MSKTNRLSELIDKEKLLYLEVEQLRYSLYLHDSSLIFEFFSAFYFAGQDIRRLFIRAKKEKLPVTLAKQLSINSLNRKKRNLLLLSKTPYAWIVYLIRKIGQKRSSRVFQQTYNNPLVIFGSTDAKNLQSRSVQIARSLAEKNNIIYIEGVFDEGSQPGFRIIEESNYFTAIRLTIQKTFHLNYQKPSPQEVNLLKRSLKLFSLDFKDFRLSDFKTYIHHPFWSFILSPKKKAFYFDHAEDFFHQKNAAPHIILAEKKLLKDASIVTAPQQSLLRNKKDIVVKNGVDWELFKDSSKTIQTCDVGLCWIKKPVLGFIGTLDERIDEVLLGKLASSFPSASIILVGNTDYRPSIEVAEQYPNIFPVGIQPYEKLPLFLQSFDILITPFKYNKSTSITHPEFPLYLASGKPIVATALVTYGVDKGLCYNPKSHEDWIRAITEALKEKKRSKKRLLRIAAAKKLTWKSTLL